MKEKIETVVPRRKFISGNSYEARKMSTGHRCEPLVLIENQFETFHFRCLEKVFPEWDMVLLLRSSSGNRWSRLGKKGMKPTA
jgi:hypothetical protein